MSHLELVRQGEIQEEEPEEEGGQTKMTVKSVSNVINRKGIISL